MIAVVDRITLPPTSGSDEFDFALHAGMQPKVLEPQTVLSLVGALQDDPLPVDRYRLRVPPGTHSVTLRYEGRIVHPPLDYSKHKGRGRKDTPGLISSHGVYLDGNSYWYPSFENAMLTFSLSVTASSGWTTVSQGVGHGVAETVRWTERHPQDQIYLVGGRFHEYSENTPWAKAMVYLRESDSVLADRYLQATGRYLDLYSRLIGPYPYKKFALVENFWETGFGMPSFTLLGPRVIRLPFIVYTSYPHEILHNWWGNSVYIDYASGNWAEGLTTYLADYLMAEERGDAANYRRGSLQKYADYVASAQDFPLRDFQARHGEVTQAIGYSKSMMFFHMLRLQLGDRVFVQGLRKFYQDNKFRPAGFNDLKKAFEAVSGTDLGTMFSQWIDRTGAPRLQLRNVSSTKEGDHYRVRGMLEQVQTGLSYILRVPVAIQLEGEGSASETTILMRDKRARIDLAVPTMPLRLAVDPAFDVFRRLDPAEIPASLGQVFGAQRVTFVLPSAAPRDLRNGYQQLAESWAGSDDQVVWDKDLKTLPRDRAVWLFGWENRFREVIAQALTGQAVRFTHRGAQVSGHTLSRNKDSLTLAARRDEARQSAIVWTGTDNAAALPGLARKLPHYGKYSYLVFTGNDPSNTLKGQWPVLHSPLTVNLTPSTEEQVPLQLPTRSPLTAIIAPRH
jgi:aminopeptidase N